MHYYERHALVLKTSNPLLSAITPTQKHQFDPFYPTLVDPALHFDKEIGYVSKRLTGPVS